MKTIKLISLSLLNFKGIGRLTINLDGGDATICGDNGIGKTSVFDAFTWVLFGKDSFDRKKFDIKTRDAEGNVIHRLSHEVSAVLDVDGIRTTLRRVYKEDWVKKSGCTEEVFNGHHEERYYNDVPCNVRDYDEKIADICNEQVFKFITSPFYFSSQKADVQRQMLFDMAATRCDEAIAADSETFRSLFAMMGDKTLAEYKKEILCKKANVTKDKDTIPARIEERQRDIADKDENTFSGLDKQLAEAEKQLAATEQMIADENKRINDCNAKEIANTRHIADLKRQLCKAENDVENRVLKDYYDRVSESNAIGAELYRTDKNLESSAKRMGQLKDSLAQRMAKRNELLAEWREINSRQFPEFDDNEFICPVCGRRYEAADIESKKEQLIENFNKQKAADIEKNKVAGLDNKKYIDETNKMIADYEKDIKEYTAKKKELLEKQKSVQVGDKPSTIEARQNDPECIRIRKEIEEADNTVFTIDDDAQLKVLKQQKNDIVSGIDTIKGYVHERDTYRDNIKRISELKEQLRSVSEEESRLQQILNTIESFEKYKVETTEKTINSLFNHVTFKMYEQQINGGQRAICEANLDGKPLSTCSNAERINVGLDIINAICRYRDVSAPIIIDNAESINSPIPTVGQQIRLVVTKDKTITIL